MLKVTWQEKLDELAYPPTHHYRVDDMSPTGVLARRASIVESYIRRGGRRRSALEVGFNKGFFLHRFGRYFDSVDGCEPWREYFDLVDAMRRDQAWTNIRSLHCGGFLDMRRPENHEPYDFVFLGNCMHYLFRDACGFGFVPELARRCHGQLLIEGFTSLDGDDVYMIGSRKKWPIELQRAFNDAAFDDAMSPWFRRVDSHPSPTGADRRFMYFERRLHSDKATS